VITSHVLDLTNIWQLHIPMFLLSGLLIMTFARGGFGFALGSSVTKFFGIFTIWCVICLPLSVWRAASWEYTRSAIEGLLIYLIIVQTVRTREDWRKISTAYAYAVTFLAIYSFFRGHIVEGRMALGTGTFGDPNDFALLLLEGLPFLALKAAQASQAKKLLYWGCMLPVLMAFTKTGSRAGLLALAIMVIVTFFLSSGAQRIAICVLVVVGLGCSAVFLPGYLKARYLTIFSPASGPADAFTQSRLESDIASSEERRELLEQGITITFQHPLFGVGPGCFPWVALNQRRERGWAGPALVSHNTYTQISSETGLPGFILYFGTLILCLKYTFVSYKRGQNSSDKDLANYTRAYLTTVTVFAVGSFFLSMGYSTFVAVLVSLGASLHNVTEKSRRE
jgi:O-antigen ligase